MSDAPLPNTDTSAISFKCGDCGSQVYRAWLFPDEPHICFVCRFIRQVSEEGRAALRAHLYDLQQFAYWDAVGAYRDETLPERECERCHNSFRGPGLYCCRRCALEDA